MPGSPLRAIRGTRRATPLGPQRPIALRNLGEDAETAVSFEALYRRSQPADGERRLLLAVLEDGIRTLLKYAAATRGRPCRLRQEAWRWMQSDDQADVFAYAAICEALDIDPGRLRARVRSELEMLLRPAAVQLH